MVSVAKNKNSSKTIFCYLGHHKCGSQWIQSIVREFCNNTGLIHGHAFSNNKFKPDFPSYLEEKNFDFFSYTNANYKDVLQLSNFQGFHVIRDPRDIVVSAYFSHLYSHPTDNNEMLQKEREILKSLSQEEGLIQEIKFNASNFQNMYDWDYYNPNILEIKMEDLMKDSYGVFVDIFQFLGVIIDEKADLDERLNYMFGETVKKLQQKFLKKTIVPVKIKKVPHDKVLGIVYRNSFKKKTKGRKPGQESQISHYRKGISGDWKNYFNQDHINTFKEEYGDLLVKLGYEKDNDWSL